MIDLESRLRTLPDRLGDLQPAADLADVVRRSHRRHARRRRAAGGLLAAAVVAAGALVAVPALDQGSKPAQGRLADQTSGEHALMPAQVQAQLDRWDASAAAAPPSAPAKPGQYMYIKVTGTEVMPVTEAPSPAAGNTAPPACRTQYTRQAWTAADLAGRIRVTYGPCAPLDGGVAPPAPQSLDETGPAAPGTVPSVYVPSYPFLLSLPTDPARLLDRLRHDATAPPDLGGQDAAVFGVVGNLLGTTGQAVAPPKLRAALYRVAAGIDGVSMVGGVADFVGRPAVALAYTDSHGWRNEYLIDPDTGAWLGERGVQTGDQQPGVSAGTVTNDYALVRSGFVGSTTATP